MDWRTIKKVMERQDWITRTSRAIRQARADGVINITLTELERRLEDEAGNNISEFYYCSSDGRTRPKHERELRRAIKDLTLLNDEGTDATW